MPSLAGFKYRRILEEDGGPVARMSVGELPVYGRTMYHANAWLSDKTVTWRRHFALYSDADGTGTADTPMVARHVAISEAMERWAYRVTVHSRVREAHGFHVDESSNGMAAFPGVFKSEARRRALLEAVERSSVIAWWEGATDGELRSTDWPGVSALVIPSPIGFGVTVIAFRTVRPDCFAYGQGASTSVFGACERAVIELSRNEYVLGLRRVSRGLSGDDEAANVFERRCLFFSTAEGHALFLERVGRKTSPKPFRSELICDGEVPGPWSEYATVWRCLVRPASGGFLSDSERYFFW